jgi:hypothetical protein
MVMEEQLVTCTYVIECATTSLMANEGHCNSVRARDRAVATLLSCKADLVNCGDPVASCCKLMDDVLVLAQE